MFGYENTINIVSEWAIVVNCKMCIFIPVIGNLIKIRSTHLLPIFYRVFLVARVVACTTRAVARVVACTTRATKKPM